MKLEFINAYYVELRELTVQREELDRYRGFVIVSEEENGRCKIVMPAMIKVVVQTNKPQQLTFRAIDKVMDLYPECNNLKEAFKAFLEDSQKGKLDFSLNEHYALVIAR